MAAGKISADEQAFKEGKDADIGGEGASAAEKEGAKKAEETKKEDDAAKAADTAATEAKAKADGTDAVPEKDAAAKEPVK